MRFKKSIVSLLFVFAMCLSAHSQIIQTGTLTGNVIDKDGGPLPGVSVTIKSPALMTPKLSTVTNEKGRFRFPSLPPGVYSVTYELTGFKTLIRESVRISVGETITLIDQTLELSPIEETIVITGQAPVVDVQKTTATASYQKEFLESIPAQRQRIAVIFSLIPGGSNETYHGSSTSDQAFILDGVNISNPSTGAILASWSFDIIEELSVDTGALRAEYGNVRGAVINTVTKSGGNEFHGHVGFYARNKNLQADNSKGTPLEGQYVGFNFENDATFNLGGPIIKNKLWFFANITDYYMESYVAGYPWDKPGTVAEDNLRYYPYAKLSWQINDSNKLVSSFGYKNFRYHNRNASMYRNEDTTWLQNNPSNTFNLQWTKFFGANLFINVKTGLCTDNLVWTAKNDKIGLYDSVTRLYSQNYGYDESYYRPRLQFTFDATYFVDEWMGSHEFKTGLDMMHGLERYSRKSYIDPRYGLGNLIYLRSGVPDYILHYEDNKRENENIIIGGFIQDSWRPIERLTLNIGFRFDHQEGIIPKQGEERKPIVYGGKTYDLSVKNTFKPIVWNSLSPRFGLAYSLTGDGKTVIKASFARYYQQALVNWFSAVNPNGAVSWRQGLNPDWTLRGGPYLFSAAAESKMDPNLKIPYLDEFTVGIEREIMKDTKVSLRYIRKSDRNDIEDMDMNAIDMNALKRGELAWTNYTPYGVTDPFNGNSVTFWGVTNTAITSAMYITNPPGLKRDYDGIEVIMNKRYSHGWQLFSSYVYSYARNLINLTSGTGTSLYNNPNSLINAFGLDPSVYPHQFKLQSTLNGPWGINISGLFTYLSGAPDTRTIRSSDLGLNLAQGSVTINAEEKGARLLPNQANLDIRAEKAFNLGKFGKLALMLDFFNLFNANTATSQEKVSSNPALFTFGKTTGILSPRILRLGVKLDF
ncbi:MAG: TonB-dependent receptor [Candidatus Aminicenantes bacterium]|nr:TonB-dependent receptor [Candidatus Aminicenantes bacterium]